MLACDEVASLIAAPMIAMGAGPIGLPVALKLAHDPASRRDSVWHQKPGLASRIHCGVDSVTIQAMWAGVSGIDDMSQRDKG